MENLKDKMFNNIKWIDLIDSKIQWPTLWISVCTHWWEIVWLDILKYLIEEIDIKNNLKKWKIFLILNNIKACKKCLS